MIIRFKLVYWYELFNFLNNSKKLLLYYTVLLYNLLYNIVIIIFRRQINESQTRTHHNLHN